MDCTYCGDEIGSIMNPIFVLIGGDATACRDCFFILERNYPDPGLAQFDPDMVSAKQSKNYFDSLGLEQKCPQCRSSAGYPMLISWLPGKPKAICAHEFHETWIDFALRPTIIKLFRRWFS